MDMGNGENQQIIQQTLMKVTILRIKSRVKEYMFGLLEINMKENIRTMKEME